MTRRRLVSLITVGVVVLAALVAFVAFGGFEKAAAPRAEVTPGQDMDGGNLVYRFTSATAQYDAGAFGDPWTVMVSGEVRNPTDSSQLVDGHQSLVGFADTKKPGIRSFTFVVDVLADDGALKMGRQAVPPDDQWLPLTAKFTFPEDNPPGDQVMVRVMRLVYSDDVVFGLGGYSTWHMDHALTSTVVHLACERLPDAGP